MAGLDPAIQYPAPHGRKGWLDPRVKPGDDSGWGTTLGPTALPNPVSFPRQRESILATKTTRQIAFRPAPGCIRHTPPLTPPRKGEGEGRRRGWGLMVRGSLRSHLTMRGLGKTACRAAKWRFVALMFDRFTTRSWGRT
jgi:hypothetical protein